jgi:signal transduction histidine kinase
MRLVDIMSRDVLTISIERTVAQAAEEMAERGCGAILVEDHGQLVGIFTERDILTRIVARGRDPKTTPVGFAMSSDPVYLALDATTDVDGALEIMETRRFRHLPILDGKKIVGIVSLRDLMHQRAVDLTRERDDRTRKLIDVNAELQLRNQELTEQSMRRVVAEKLAAVSTLCLGVANELDAPLRALTSASVDLAQFAERALDDEGVARHVSVTRGRAREAAAVTLHILSRLRNFSQGGGLGGVRPVSITSCLEEIVATYRNIAPPRVEFVLTLGDTSAIWAVEEEIRLAFMCLLDNALQAVAERGTDYKHGKICITTWAAKNGGVVVDLADNGVGLPEDVVPRVFEPFFTTRGDRGTGLGASAAFGIVQRHGGSLEVASKLGEGSSFRVALPKGKAPIEVADPE